MRMLRYTWAAGLTLIAASAAHAQGTPVATGVGRPGSLLDQVVSMLIFTLLGIGLAILGFKLFDWVIPFDVEREICEKNNIAAAVLGGAMVLGICIIVAAVVQS